MSLDCSFKPKPIRGAANQALGAAFRENVMGPTDNKALATDFFDHFNGNDIAGALATLADDATWWVAGRPGAHPFVGTLPKERVAKLFYRMVSQTTDGLRMTLKSVVAEGNKVALELESYAQLKNGRVYNQQYHTLMEFRDGKICAVREYLDTQHVLAVWFAPDTDETPDPAAAY